MLRSIALHLPLVLALLLPVTAPAHTFEGILIIAHRGAGFELDENTLEACQQSYQKGFRGFEIDLRMTSDGHLVLMHDETLKRTTGQEGIVEQTTLADLQKLRTSQNGLSIPTAEDLFAYFKDKPDIFIELEMKTTNAKFYPEERVREYCQKLKDAASVLPAGTYAFTSFDPRPLAVMHKIAPQIPTSLITGHAPTEQLIQDAVKLGCSRVAVVMDHTTRKWVKAAQKAGLKVAGWPTRSRQDASLAVGLGVDTLTTDVPSQLIAAP